MKSMIVLSGILVAALLLTVTEPAQAQQNAAWCMSTDFLDCSYDTLRQCRASARGADTTAICVRNPRLARKRRYWTRWL